jgi:hypothetical protein
LHFEDGKSPYDSSDGVIDRLKQHVPDYEKRKDVFLERGFIQIKKEGDDSGEKQY